MLQQPKTLHDLEIIGGDLALDFANTVNMRPVAEHDYLGSYADLLAWALQQGTITAQQATRLSDIDAQELNGWLLIERSHKLREIIYRIFSSHAAGKAPQQSDLDALLAAYGEAVSAGRFASSGDGFALSWAHSESPAAPLWPVAHAAGELLRSSELGQVKECPGCGWLFVDRSKNGRRRWCSMNTCGVRDKMRTYRQRRVMRET